MIFSDFDFFVLTQDIINIFPYCYIWPECETYFLPVSFYYHTDGSSPSAVTAVRYWFYCNCKTAFAKILHVSSTELKDNYSAKPMFLLARITVDI